MRCSDYPHAFARTSRPAELGEIDVRGPSAVHVHWEDRSAFRVIGALLLSVGTILGSVGVVAGMAECGRFSCKDPYGFLLWGGAVLASASLGVGLAFALRNDDRRLESVALSP